jgi:TolB protein
VDVAAGTATPPRVIGISPLFINQVLPYFDQYALSHRVWAPDGASILLPVIAEDGAEALQVLPADGSPGRVLAEGSIGFWSP